MAYSLSSLVSIVIVCLSLLMSLSSSADLIGSVCAIARNPQLCLQALKSDPRSASADLAGLGRISIGLSLNSAKQTSALIASLSNGVTDPKLKGRYDTCAENYGDAIDDLNGALQALNGKDVGTFRTKASAALDGPDTCQDSFQGAPAAPPRLQQANTKTEDLVGIVLAVGSRLDGGVV